VVHAGLTGKLSVSAKAFWEERFMDTMRLKGEPVDAHIRSIDKSMYSDTREAVLYKKWLKNEHDNVLTIREVKDWASVFGIRFGALWSFYLQNCATVTTIRMVKKADVTKTKSGNNTFYTHAPTGGNVEVSTVKSGVFGIKKSIYKVQQQYSRPLFIREFYPNGPGGGSAIIRVPTEQLRLI
jgi:hypothetical protein